MTQMEHLSTKTACTSGALKNEFLSSKVKPLQCHISTRTSSDFDLQLHVCGKHIIKVGCLPQKARES